MTERKPNGRLPSRGDDDRKEDTLGPIIDEQSVILLKHPFNETIHPWWAYGMFVEELEQSLANGWPGVPLQEAEVWPQCGSGNDVYTTSFLQWVTHYIRNVLIQDYTDESLVMGYGAIDDFSNYDSLMCWSEEQDLNWRVGDDMDCFKEGGACPVTDFLRNNDRWEEWA